MKYNLKHDLLRLNQLHKIAEEWISSGVYHQQISANYHFKLSLSKFQGLSSTFFVNCLVYMVSRMLPWMIIEWKTEEGVKLNDELKKYYRELLFKSFFKANNMFEVFIVYLIKLTARFLEVHFNNFLVDEPFQTELCIILYYTFLGIEINQKTYKLLQNKFIIKRCIPPNPKQSRISQQSQGQLSVTAKNSFLSNVARKSSLKTNYTGEKQSFKYLRRSGMSFAGRFKEPVKKDNGISEINALLKENLHVAPLPPLKRKRINAREFERLLTEPTSNAQIVPNSTLSQIQNQKYNQPKFIFSNQLSPSLKNYYPGSLLFQLNSKKVKITQTSQNFHNERSLQIITKEIDEEHVDGTKEIDVKYGPSSKKVPANEWTKLVGDLKKKVFNLRCQTETQDKSTAHKTKRVEKISCLPTSTDIQTPNIQVQEEEKAQVRTIMTSIPTLVSKLSESDSSQSEDEHPVELEKVDFKRQHEKISFVVENFQSAHSESQKEFNKLFTKGKASRNGRFLTSSIIRSDQDLFFSLCKIRKGSILQQKQQKINRHDSVLNQYKS